MGFGKEWRGAACTRIVALCALLAGAAGAEVVRLGADAAANGRTIQQAVDAAAAKGGGRVEIPVGTWLTGSIELKSGVELHVPEGATLKGSTDRRDYNADDAFPENFRSAGEEWNGGHLVWALRAENVAITGSGTIDGNGPAFFGACDEDSRWPWYRYGLKLHPTNREWFRPGVMVAFFCCRNIRLADIHLNNPPSWTCHIRCSDGVDIRGVTVDADRTIANSDGFSIDCTRNVRVEKCTLKTGDDSFAIRASCRQPGHAATNFCENIVINDCDVWSCAFAIRFGVGTGTIRNIEVTDLRVHEAATAAFGFIPAWVDAARNCHIENIRLRRCTVSDCMRPMSGGPSAGDSKVVGIRYEDCVFNTLLPAVVTGGPRCEVSFSNCVRNTITKFSSRHRRGWNEGEIRNKRSVFVEIKGDRSRVTVENCRPLPFDSTGVLLLGFDDRYFADWERALPLFAKYGAHASFFISGEFNPEAVRTAKRLMAGGHTIGLHGQHHGKVPEVIAKKGWEGYCAAELNTVRRQCDVAYIPARNFAYPNHCRDEASDKLLLKRFDRLRGGLREPLPPDGGKPVSIKPLATDDRVFFPVAELPRRRLLSSILIGEAYDTEIANVVACIKRAGERREVLVLASHGIRPDAKGIHMKTEWLEAILAAAKEAGVAVLGYDEIPLVR